MDDLKRAHSNFDISSELWRLQFLISHILIIYVVTGLGYLFAKWLV